MNTPFPIQNDLRFRDTPTKTRYWFLGIPSAFWKLIKPLPFTEKLDSFLSKNSGRILFCADTEIAASSLAFSYLAATKLNSTAISLADIPNLGNYKVDFLLVYGLSSTTPEWMVDKIKLLWYRYSLVITYKGTLKNFVTKTGLEPDMAKTVKEGISI